MVSSIVSQVSRQVPLVSWRKIEDLLEFDRRSLVLLAEQAGRYYKPFDRRKLSGQGKWRHIDNPQDDLKAIQKRIQQRLLLHLSFPDTIVGGIRKRSTIDHAKFHLRKPCVVTLDIKGCFPSISNERVFRVFQNSLNASPQIARILTQLTTFQHRLPQGAPTSPTIANLALLPLHNDLLRLAEQSDLDLSIYVDDIALSGDNAVVVKVIESACDLIRKHGFRVSWSKLNVQSISRPQTITGLNVNRRIDLPREFLVSIDSSIRKLADSEIIFERDLNAIWGRIKYVKYVRPTVGLLLEETARRCLPEKGCPGGKHRWETRTCARFNRDHSK